MDTNGGKGSSPEQIYTNKLKEKSLKATCCDIETLALKAWMVDELADELKAHNEYEEVALKMHDIDFADIAKNFQKTSEQEHHHWMDLVAAINILNEVCACEGGLYNKPEVS